MQCVSNRYCILNYTTVWHLKVKEEGRCVTYLTEDLVLGDLCCDKHNTTVITKALYIIPSTTGWGQQILHIQEISHKVSKYFSSNMYQSINY